MRHQIPCCLSLIALLLLWTPTTQATEDETSSVFIDRVDVNVVNVEVIVTDRAGNRVADLIRDDFEIYEDGQQVEISNFYASAREDRLLRDLDSDRALIAGEPLPPPNIRERPEEQQLNLLVYVDHFNIRHTNRTRALQGLEGFLEDRIIQGDRIMLVGYDGTLDVIQPFTRDRQQITEGLRSMHKVTAHRQLDDLEQRRILLLMRQTQREGGDGNKSRTFELLRSYVQSARTDLRRSAQAIRDAVRSLAGLPGRKAILYVSDGLPQRPGESLYQHMLDLYGIAELRERDSLTGQRFVDPFIEALGENESHLFNSITREANAHQVTFYTLDARGAHGGTGLSAAYAELSTSPGGHMSLDSIRSQNLLEPLIAMADATGGSSIFNTLSYDQALEKVADDFDSFYSLGYATPGGGDGKFHKIEVRVNQPGLKVRHRGGFVDKPLAERVADRTLSSLLLDMDKNPLGINLSFGSPSKERGNYLLPLLVRIPLREVTLLSNGQVEEGRLRIFLAVKDESGISDLHDIPYPVSIPRDQLTEARARDIGYTAELKIREGQPKIAVGIWDELSGTESYVHQKVLVGE